MAALRSIVIVSESEEWVAWAVDVCERLRSVPEATGWHRASAVDIRPNVLLLDVLDPPVIQKTALLEKWAGWAWQPLSVVSLAPVLRLTQVVQTLEHLRYRYAVGRVGREAHLRKVESEVADRLDQCAWLVPELARRVDCREPRMVEVLWRAIELIPGLTSVEGWAQAVDLERREDLEAVFRGCGGPHPKVLLDWLRFLKIVEYCSKERYQVARKRIARRFGYRSADYVGKRAKQLTGLPLGRLLEGGTELVLAIAEERLG